MVLLICSTCGVSEALAQRSYCHMAPRDVAKLLGLMNWEATQEVEQLVTSRLSIENVVAYRVSSLQWVLFYGSSRSPIHC